MNATGIEWCHVFGSGSGFTVNPVFGCTRGCSYCYARTRIAPRVGHLCNQYPDPARPEHAHLDPNRSLCEQFFPHAHLERLKETERRRKPSGIFVGSCTDLWDPHVPQEWRDEIWRTVEACPQHVFFVLTKRPENLTAADAKAAGHLPNLWVGVSITSRYDYDRALSFTWWQMPRRFISYEPVLGPVDPLVCCLGAWIIVGAQTGPGALQPRREWVTDVVALASGHSIPVFLKDNLRPLLGDDYVDEHQQWPQAMTTPRFARLAATGERKHVAPTGP